MLTCWFRGQSEDARQTVDLPKTGMDANGLSMARLLLLDSLATNVVLHFVRDHIGVRASTCSGRENELAIFSPPFHFFQNINTRA